ncbi:c-type cytochrome biogenesis protein CcmI [Ruegeria aquimaris]|uniref:C-type cytochrome biogenesis protein CcmI n=1 Tax=Ruegeria aquimaris TaxID=2984333 RepID=A0ABT3ALP1_9RHOB|nr:c-type cytochrome biogenesis protein CcmI [Ruegeria sp. XHP0148]MCV2889596.1 c-type cytochrome biogenesis protein CcmI [Ruegeria sp. XHP0148]
MIFWILVSLMALAVAGLLALAALRARNTAEPAAAYDLRVYRDQLAGVDRDLARGVIDAADAERIRTEISRRILAADTQIQAEAKDPAQTRRGAMIVALSSALVIVAGSLWFYSSLGAPGYGDLPLKLRLEIAEQNRTDRPAQGEAETRMPAQAQPQIEPGYADLLQKLRETVAQRPDDIQGHMLLAQHEANTGNLRAAYAAKARVIELLQGDTTAADYSEQAELMIMAAGGYVSPEAEAVLRQALLRDPEYGPARYYWGVMLIQVGRPDLAFEIWARTLEAAPADASWAEAIRTRIGEVALRAGVDYTPPPVAALPGPSQEDMQAASEMDPDTRNEMIRGMVERLSERLATDGGTPQEWARLIGALSVLGETERAGAILTEARQVYAETPEALALIESAAQQAGLGQ